MKNIFKRLTLTGLLKVIVLTMIQAALLAGCGGGAVGKRVLPAKMSGKKASAESAHFSLWQLPSQTRSQMMSYVLSTRGGKVMVIDGGNRGDAPGLREFLEPLGNRIHAWFLSHPHPDHVDALTAILQEPGAMEIDVIYASLPDEKWVAKHEPKPPTHLESVRAFQRAVQKTGFKLMEPLVGQEIRIDGVLIEILGVKNPEITSNAINNSSLVLRVSDVKKSVLFPGDLGVEGGQKLLESAFRNRLRADYIQMSHHGQRGVDLDFYRAVSPTACLWPTPQWLWENDSGNGPGSGPWETLTVRKWMRELGVQTHYVSAFGLQHIE